MRRSAGALAAALLVGCVAIHGPCEVDRQAGRAWCEPGGFMVLVPGSAILDIRRGTLDTSQPAGSGQPEP